MSTSRCKYVNIIALNGLYDMLTLRMVSDTSCPYQLCSALSCSPPLSPQWIIDVMISFDMMRCDVRIGGLLSEDGMCAWCTHFYDVQYQIE